MFTRRRLNKHAGKLMARCFSCVLTDAVIEWRSGLIKYPLYHTSDAFSPKKIEQQQQQRVINQRVNSKTFSKNYPIGSRYKRPPAAVGYILIVQGCCRTYQNLYFVQCILLKRKLHGFVRNLMHIYPFWILLTHNWLVLHLVGLRQCCRGMHTSSLSTKEKGPTRFSAPRGVGVILEGARPLIHQPIPAGVIPTWARNTTARGC